MALSVPWMVMSAVPFAPLSMVIPAVVASVSVPLVTDSVVRSSGSPAVPSSTVMALPVPLEKTSDTSSATFWLPGTVFAIPVTGTGFTCTWWLGRNSMNTGSASPPAPGATYSPMKAPVIPS